MVVVDTTVAHDRLRLRVLRGAITSPAGSDHERSAQSERSERSVRWSLTDESSTASPRVRTGSLTIPARSSYSGGPSSLGLGIPHDGLRAPDRIRVHGRLAGSDAIVGYHHDDDGVWQDIKARLAPTLGGRWRPVAELLHPLFDSGTLKPLLSALSRGAEWKAPIMARGREIGEVTLDALVVGDTFKQDGRGPVSIEFEAGAESQAGDGAFREERWRTIGGVYIKGDVTSVQYRGTLGGYGDSVRLTQRGDSGRVVAKTKTVEKGVIFHGLIEVGVRVKFYNEASPEGHTPGTVTVDERHAVDLEVTVSVPLADCPDAEGQLPTVAEHYAPPPRITRFQRFGSTDTIWDFYPLPLEPLPPDAPTRLLRQTIPEWTGEIDMAGAEVFGSAWKRVAEQIAAQLQPGAVHQRLKEMGSDQPIEIHGLPVGASVEVSARVIRMEHIRGTAQTEFTAGTEIRRGILSQAMTTRAGTVPGQQALIEPPDHVDISVAPTASAGRDHLQVHAEGSRTGMQAKTKGPGEVFDGIVQLRFKMRYSPPLRTSREAVARTRAGVRAVIERAECAKAASHDETIWEAGQSDPPDAPKNETDLRTSQEGVARAAAESAGLPLPPEEVWSRGLPDTSVILDLWGMERLRQELRQRLSAVAGAGSWAVIQSTVLGAYNQNRLMANLAGMTRHVPLEGFDLPHRIPGSFEVAATAEVQALMFSRHVPKAELAPQGSTDSQFSGRRFAWWTAQLQGQLGGRFGQASSQALLLTGGGQYRHRTGWRLAAGGQAIANAKFNVPLVYFTGLVRLHFSASMASRATEFDVTLPFMVGLPARLTLLLAPQTLQSWASEGRLLPASGSEYRQLADHAVSPAAPATGYLVAEPREPGKFAVPERVENGRLSRSDFVLSVHDDGNQLVTHVIDALQPLGRAVTRLVRSQLDTAAIKPQIPGMTNGDVIKVPLSGNGWSGHLSVTAVVRGLTYRESVPKVEFENGTENYSTLGLSLEERLRRILGGQYRGKFPHTSLAITGTLNRDTTEAMTSDVTAREIAKGKTVETGALLNGDIEFRIDYHLRRFNVVQFRPPPDARRVAVRVAVMVPERDMRTFPEASADTQPAGPDSEAARGAAPTRGPQPQLPDRWFAPPERIRRRLGLSSSDIVLDVWPDRQPTSMADILRNAGLDQRGREVFGRSWPRMLEKILTEVDLRRLHFELKAMTAGHPITVDAPRGMTGRALITARLTFAQQVSSTGQTEFNVGTSRSRDRSTAEPRTTSSASRSRGLSAQILGSSDPTGHLHASVQAGPTFVGFLGRNDFEFLSTQTNTGMTTKVKVPGAVYDGRVRLHIRLVSAELARLHQGAQVNVRFLAEQDESEPVANREATVFRGEPLRSRELAVPSTAGAVAPPSRVWSLVRGQGLRDTDTIRGLPDTGGLFPALEAAGKTVFGAGSWGRIAPLMREALSHASLSAGLPAMTRGEAMLNPLAFRELGRPQGQISGQARIVLMQYERTSAKAEMNPVNELTSRSVRSEQYWWQGGLQIQLGAEFGPVTVAGVAGGLYRRRNAAVLGSTGRVLASAKIPAPTAVYSAYVLTTFTLREGTRQRVVTGVIPAEIGIPIAQTTPAAEGETEFRPPLFHEEPAEIAGTAERELTAEENQDVAQLLGAGHELGPEQLARAFGVVARLRDAQADPADVPATEYLRSIGGAVGVPVRGQAGARQLVGLLDVAGEIFGDDPVTVDEVAALRQLGVVTRRRSGWRFWLSPPVTVGGLRAEYERRGLASGREVTAAHLRELVRTTQAETLLGTGHKFSTGQVAQVFRLVSSLRRDAGPKDAPTAEYLRWLGWAVGLHHQDRPLARWTRRVAGTVRMHRLFQLLDLATEIFGDEQVGVADLADLRRLTDMVAIAPSGGRLRRLRPVTPDRLRAEFRTQLGLPDDANVTTAELRDLVAMTRTAKAARRLSGGGPIQRADLRGQAAQRQAARRAAKQVRAHLSWSAEHKLGIERQRELLRELAVADAGGTHLQEAMDLLDDAHDDDLRAIFSDDGSLRALLDMAFIGTGSLRGRYNAFLRRWSSVTIAEDDLGIGSGGGQAAGATGPDEFVSLELSASPGGDSARAMSTELKTAGPEGSTEELAKEIAEAYIIAEAFLRAHDDIGLDAAELKVSVPPGVTGSKGRAEPPRGGDDLGRQGDQDRAGQLAQGLVRAQEDEELQRGLAASRQDRRGPVHDDLGAGSGSGTTQAEADRLVSRAKLASLTGPDGATWQLSMGDLVDKDELDSLTRPDGDPDPEPDAARALAARIADGFRALEDAHAGTPDRLDLVLTVPDSHTGAADLFLLAAAGATRRLRQPITVHLGGSRFNLCW